MQRARSGGVQRNTLPRASIMPQLAKNLMRHADMRTTLEHYTDLRLADLAAAISGVPEVEGLEV